MEKPNSLKTISDKQKEIVAEFSSFKDWEERYKKIIDLGKGLPTLSDEFYNDKYKVQGCQSSVWMHASKQSGKIIYIADSDALIVKGLIALLLLVYSGHSPDEIMQTPPHFLEELGLNTHLSQTRANGLASMVKQIRLYAYALK